MRIETKIENIIRANDTLLYISTLIRQNYYMLFFDDIRMIKHIYKKRFGCNPNLITPHSFGEKIQWLKINWYDELAERCADKYLVREYIESTIGNQYLNELYGIYDDITDIDINDLPEQFVLKGTHGSHFNIICQDKNELNWEKEKTKIQRWSKINYYWQNREWVYRNLKPRFVVEKYLSDNLGASLTDYKFFCFNGETAFCQVIRNRDMNESIDFYDLKWNHLPFTGLRNLPNASIDLCKPDGYEKMIELATILSKPFPFVRVDFYNIQGQIIFGELTFFPQSGLGEFSPKEYDTRIAKMIDTSSIGKRS